MKRLLFLLAFFWCLPVFAAVSWLDGVSAVNVNKLNGITLLTTACIKSEDQSGAAIDLFCLDGSDDLNIGNSTGVDNVNIDFEAGGVLIIDGTMVIDAGVVTGLTALTSTAITGTLQTAAQANVTSLGALTALIVDAGLVVGNATGVTVGGSLSEIQELGTVGADSSMIFGRFSANASPAFVQFVKSRAAIGSFATIETADVLGEFDFFADDGVDYATQGAQIKITTEGTIAENRIPTKIEFKTGTDAAPTVVTTALKLDSAQDATFTNDIIAAGLDSTTGTNLLLSATNIISKDSSSRIYKENIIPSQMDTSVIFDMVPMDFNFIFDKNKKTIVGWVAEEVYEVSKGLVNLNSEGNPESWDLRQALVMTVAELNKTKQEMLVSQLLFIALLFSLICYLSLYRR